MKKAICTISVGTIRAEAERSCILPIEEAIAAAFPERSLFRAFTSRPILKKRKERGLPAESAAELIRRLRREGWEDVIISPIHMIAGEEYQRITDCADGMKLAPPLLDCEADEDWMAELLSSISKEAGSPLLAMGHGSSRPAGQVYGRIQKNLPENCLIACLDGGPGLQDVLPLLEALPGRKITLLPLMITAGSHAEAMLSDNGPGSWKAILAAHGFDVHARMQGLGSLRAVQERFVQKAQETCRGKY